MLILSGTLPYLSLQVNNGHYSRNYWLFAILAPFCLLRSIYNDWNIQQSFIFRQIHNQHHNRLTQNYNPQTQTHKPTTGEYWKENIMRCLMHSAPSIKLAVIWIRRSSQCIRMPRQRLIPNTKHRLFSSHIEAFTPCIQTGTRIQKTNDPAGCTNSVVLCWPSSDFSLLISDFSSHTFPTNKKCSPGIPGSAFAKNSISSFHSIPCRHPHLASWIGFLLMKFNRAYSS